MSRADSRVRSPGSLTCVRCPAETSALDARPEAYHNPAAVWWGVFAPSPGHVAMDQAVTVRLRPPGFPNDTRVGPVPAGLTLHWCARWNPR